jgi:hypothetical protein
LWKKYDPDDTRGPIDKWADWHGQSN